MADIGVHKKILKGKVILNLSVRDAFASRIFESRFSQPITLVTILFRGI